MEDFDDDFGELYADVEIQASSAINGFPQSYAQQQQLSNNQLSNDSLEAPRPHSIEDCSGLGDDDQIDRREKKDLDRANDGKNQVGLESRSESESETESESESESDSDSDDEDDFDVVVNDDDFGVKNGGEDEENEFVATNMEANSTKNQVTADGGGVEQSGSGYGGERGHMGKNNCMSQYKFVRQHGSVSKESQRVMSSSGAHKEGVDYIQKRGTALGRVGRSYAGTMPFLSVHGSGFWLPWNRTILDVDIDMFEQKPWNLPGADMTDYFNFGFDEESWKSYCQSLEQLRHQTFTLGRNQVKGIRSKLDNEATADEELANRDVKEAFFSNGDRMVISRESEFPMGQFKKHIGWAIHVEDSNVERQPSMDARPPRARASDVIEITVVDLQGSSSGKDKPDKTLETKSTILEDGCGIENVKPETEKPICESHDMKKDSVGKNLQSRSASTEPKRAYDSGTESRHLQDSASQWKRRRSKSDALSSGKVDGLSRGYSRAVVKLNNSMEDNDRDSIETNPCVAGIDVLFDDQIQSSPTQSDSDTWSKASKGSNRCDPVRAQDSRRSAGDSIWEGHPVEGYDHISRKSEGYDIRRKGRDIERRSRVRSPIEENWKYRHQKVRKHSVLSMHQDEDGSHHMNRRHVYDKSHFSAHHHSSKSRLHASTFHEDSQRCREKEYFLACYDRRIVEHKTPYMRKFHQLDCSGSGDEMDLCSPREWDEDIFSSERKFQQMEDKVAESEEYFNERERMIIDREPSLENQPCFTSKYTVHVERQNLRRDCDDVRSSRRSRHDLSLEHQYYDGHALDRYSRHNPLNYREVEHLDWDIERERSLWHNGRDDTSGRSDQYLENHPLDVDYPWCIRDGDEDFDWQASRSNWDYLDRHNAYTERRHASPLCRYDVDDRRLFEKRGRHSGDISHPNVCDDKRVYSRNEAHDRQDMVRYLDEDDVDDCRLFEKHGRHGGDISHPNVRDDKRVYSHNEAHDRQDIVRYLDEDDVDDRRLFEKHGKHGGDISHPNFRDDKRVYSHNEAHDRQDMVRYLDEDDYVSKQNDFGSRGVSWTDNTQVNRHFNNDLYDEDDLDSFKGVPRNKWHGIKNGFVPGWMSRHTQVVKHKRGIVRNNGGTCDTSSKMPTKLENQKIGIRCRNLVELRHGVGERKTVQPSKQSTKTRRESNYDACATAGERVQKQQEGKYKVHESGTKNIKEIKGGLVEALQHDDLHVRNQDDTSDIEEGQIPTEEPCKEIWKDSQSGLKRVSTNQKAKSHNDYDENRMLETMARMEKRRERFKESILVNKETVSVPKPQVDPVVDISESKQQQRPLRKRRWGGS